MNSIFGAHILTPEEHCIAQSLLIHRSREFIWLSDVLNF